ncbi:MAG TPA: YlxR family protein [Acidimicrobiales bacterium]|nr:YlxR family protein [Acidimicrobiales bacterium]
MTPTRTCVGCRTARPADTLIRVVRGLDGELSVDRIGPGRGAWLCEGAADCLLAAVRRHAFDKAFGLQVSATAVERLQARLTGASEEPAPDVRG